MWRGVVFGVSAVLACAGGASADPLYTVRDLGVLPGAAESEATAINASGVVVGASATADGVHGFRYNGGIIQDLGKFPGAQDTAPASINAGGQIAGSWTTGFSPPGWQPFVYDGTYHGLDTLGAQGGQAASINDAGKIVGTLTFADHSQHAFLYDGTTHDLVPVLGGVRSSANAINNTGAIVGSIATAFSHPAQAYLYDGTLHMLGELAPGHGSAPIAINATGQVVGNAPAAVDASGNTLPRAFIWDGSIHQLNIPSGPVSQSTGEAYATGINSGGQAVGYSLHFEFGPYALLWDAGTHQGHYLDDLANLPSGWVMQEATGINDAGQIVGYGGQADAFGRLSFIHALLLTPRIPGDANLDGSVGFDDLLILAQHFSTPTTHFTEGDFDGDGTVGFSDVLLLAQHFGQVQAVTASVQVPEPGVFSVLSVAGLSVATLSACRRAGATRTLSWQFYDKCDAFIEECRISSDSVAGQGRRDGG